ncbi:hypothetical protein Tco_1336847 [Tanacetum coccineum]
MSLVIAKANPNYIEAKQATKEIETPSIGFAAPSEFKEGTIKTLEALKKQNNTILYLLIKQDLEEEKKKDWGKEQLTREFEQKIEEARKEERRTLEDKVAQLEEKVREYEEERFEREFPPLGRDPSILLALKEVVIEPKNHVPRCLSTISDDDIRRISSIQEDNKNIEVSLAVHKSREDTEARDNVASGITSIMATLGGLKLGPGTVGVIRKGRYGYLFATSPKRKGSCLTDITSDQLAVNLHDVMDGKRYPRCEKRSIGAQVRRTVPGEIEHQYQIDSDEIILAKVKLFGKDKKDNSWLSTSHVRDHTISSEAVKEILKIAALSLFNPRTFCT